MSEIESPQQRGSVPVTAPPADPRKWAAWARSVPGGHLLVLRAFLGVTFCYAGLQKLATRGFFQASNPASIQAQLKASALTTPVGHLLHPVVHIAVVVGLLISFGELAAGIGTLLGLYSRVAATGGMVLALLFFLTVSYNSSPYYYGPDIVFFFAWTPLALNGAGVPSLDAYFAERRQRERAALGTVSEVTVADGASVDRRTAVAKVAAASFVGGVVLFLGGVTAAAGRVLGRRVTSLTGPTFPEATTTAPSGGGSTTTTTTVAAGEPKPKGKLLGPASAVAVGGGVGFTDPFQSIPAYVVQPKKGEFLAFSAVCTHAGCTVSFVQSAEQFQCPCHGSIYSAVTGDVIQGPAPRPLPAIGIELSGTDLYVTD
jgi:thiosulfate dehydrogenase [quinone] large subunit